MALGLPRAEMLARMSSAELSEWVAFSTLEPFGAEASYFGHAITASTIANVNRQKGQRVYKVDEFVPKFERKKAQSVDQMLQVAEMMTIGLGGKDLREHSDGSESEIT